MSREYSSWQIGSKFRYEKSEIKIKMVSSVCLTTSRNSSTQRWLWKWARKFDWRRSTICPRSWSVLSLWIWGRISGEIVLEMKPHESCLRLLLETCFEIKFPILRWEIWKTCVRARGIVRKWPSLPYSRTIVKRRRKQWEMQWRRSF